MLPARLPSHLVLSLAFGLLASCTTNNKPAEPPRKSVNGQDSANEDGKGKPADDDAAPARGGDPGETVSPDQIADSGLSDDKFKEGRIFVNGWDGKSDQPEGRKKWTLANLAAVPLPASAGSGTAGSGSASTATATGSTATGPAATGSATGSNTGSNTDNTTTTTTASPSTETPASATPAANDQGN